MKKICVVCAVAAWCDGVPSAYVCHTYMKYGELIGEPCKTRSTAKRSFLRVCRYLGIDSDLFEFVD